MADTFFKIVEAQAIDPSPNYPDSAKAWRLRALAKINGMQVSFEDKFSGINAKSNIFRNEAEKEFTAKISDVSQAISLVTKKY